jgi:energy-coupling factor transporter ATP-binding protein EcfA2
MGTDNAVSTALNYPVGKSREWLLHGLALEIQMFFSLMKRLPLLVCLHELHLMPLTNDDVDSHSESLVRQSIEAASSKRTTVMIAHRLTTVQRADRIFVFEHGKIVEEGTHEELIQLNGIYTRMIEAQALG